MGPGGKRDKEAKGRSLPAGVDMGGHVQAGRGGAPPELPSSSACSPHSFTNSRPQRGAGHRAGRQGAEPPCLFKPPRASNEFYGPARLNLLLPHGKHTSACDPLTPRGRPQHLRSAADRSVLVQCTTVVLVSSTETTKKCNFLLKICGIYSS